VVWGDKAKKCRVMGERHGSGSVKAIRLKKKPGGGGGLPAQHSECAPVRSGESFAKRNRLEIYGNGKN